MRRTLGLPLDMDADEKRRFNKGEGCPCCFNHPERQKPTPQGSTMAMLKEVLGDDIDGIASELDDADAMGLFNS